jgi:predicted phosphodiesterase
MKLLVLSDIHLELGTALTLPPGLQYDAVVLAGDIHSPGHKAVHWAKRDSTFGGKPIILVPGNHEFYNCAMDVELEQMLVAADGSNVHVLRRDVVVVGGVRFIGCTLWTDFLLPVRQADDSLVSDLGRSLTEASRCMNDFRLIEVSAVMKSPHRGRRFRRLLRAEDTLAMHWVDRDWLRRELANSFDGPTVVVTHHAPAGGSVARQYAADWLTPAFVSDLPAAFFEVPALWVHGHTHSPFDYQRGTCRVVSNPRGYRMHDGSFENQHFNAGFIVEVSADIEVRARLNPATYEL